MPQFKSIATGNLATLTDQYAQASGGDSVWERIADEAPEETELRLQLEASDAALAEARANKVELPDPETDYAGAVDPYTGQPVDPKTGVASTPDTSSPATDTGAVKPVGGTVAPQAAPDASAPAQGEGSNS